MHPPSDEVAPGADGGEAFAGTTMPAELLPPEREIVDAIEAGTSWMVDLLAALVRAPSVLHQEEIGQEIVRTALREIGLEPVDVVMDADAIRAHPSHSPFDWDVSTKRNVVAVWQPGDRQVGRSLILNGHIDVVTPEPRERWPRDPFSAERADGWMYGRGAADMKCGLAAILGALKGLRELGLTPQAPVTFESVVEEECTGNGTLACLLAGNTADAAILAEPFGSAITTSQVGVLWFQVRIEGVSGHAADLDRGANAIERSLSVIGALRTLEREMNEAPPPPYDRFAHPIGLNVGEIHGGDWPSTSPAQCLTSYRIALYPGMAVRDLQNRIEAIVAEAAAGDPEIAAQPPEVVYRGFACEGYEIADDAPLVRSLGGAFARLRGEAPALVATTGTTDARVLGLAGGIPTVCFGPYAEHAHGVDERVYLPSVVQTAQVLGLFVRDWCGLER